MGKYPDSAALHGLRSEIACSPLPCRTRCGGERTPPPSGTAPSPATSTSLAMTSVTVPVGQTIQIQWDDQPLADYVWYYHVSEDWIISMTEPYAYPAKSAAPAQAGNVLQKVYDIKGLKKGMVTIRLYKVQPWAAEEKPVQEKYYQVEVTP